jgi:matrix metalloproteinase-14 (membrane-inserted)
LIQLAFDQWAAHGDLKFTRVNTQSKARLILSTGKGRKDNFDGPGNTLAWAYLPQGNSYNGQLLMRFDLDETWITRAGDRGILYLNVACHEFGHMLGLDHSRVKTALMAPYYAPRVTKPVENDDVKRIVKLYGRATNPPGGGGGGDNGGGGGGDNGCGGGTGKKVVVEVTTDSMTKIKINGKTATDFSLI